MVQATGCDPETWSGPSGQTLPLEDQTDDRTRPQGPSPERKAGEGVGLVPTRVPARLRTSRLRYRQKSRATTRPRLVLTTHCPRSLLPEPWTDRGRDYGDRGGPRRSHHRGLDPTTEGGRGASAQSLEDFVYFDPRVGVECLFLPTLRTGSSDDT